MSIFKKTVKYSKASKDLDNKIKNLDESLKKTGVIPDENDAEVFFVEENIPKIADKIEVIKEEEKLYDWRESLLEEVIDEEILIDDYKSENNKSLTKVENYISESNKDLIILRDQIFEEISKQTLLDLPDIKNKISKVLEIYEKLQEGILNEPPEIKNQDPLTPLNQTFVTPEDLNKHYTLFINRIQEQLATLGGGGSSKLKYLDDIVGIHTNPSAYDGQFLSYDDSIKKFKFKAVSGGGGAGENYWASTTSGIHTLSNVGIGTTNPQAKFHSYGIDNTLNTVLGYPANTLIEVADGNPWAIGFRRTDLGPSADVAAFIDNDRSFYWGGGTPDGNYYTMVGFNTEYVKLFAGASERLSTNNSGVSITGNLNISGVTTANSFVKSGGTSSQFLKADGSVDTSIYATQSYVGLATIGLASVSYVNTQVGLSTVGLASVSYVNTQVGLSTVGLASVSYVNNAIVGFITAGALNGYATQSYVGLATSGLASVSYVNNAIVGFITAGALNGYATQSYVGLATSGLLSSTGNGSSLSGIVTYIEAGAGISVDQSTGKVTITNTGGGGGGVIGITIKDEGGTVGTAGSITVLNFVGDNITATASGFISTITVATQTYVSVAGVATYASTSGVSTSATTAGYATTSGISTTSQGLTGTPNITVGIVTATSYNGSGINLTGIVTSITANSGISINQSTGNVTITNTASTLNQTLGFGNTSSLGMSVGIVTATSFVKSGGTSSQFLKADGSVDTNTYLTSTSSGTNLTGIVTSITAGSGISINQSTGNVTITASGGSQNLNTTLGFGNTSSLGMSVGIVTATSFVKSGGTSSQFLKADGSVDSNTYLTTTGSGTNLTGIVTSITAGSGISINQSTGNVTITGTGVTAGSNTTYTGNNTFSGVTTFSGNVFTTGIIKFEQGQEAYNPYNTTIGAGATVALDCSTGNTFFITSTVNGNWTANLTNLGMLANCLTNVTLLISQGTTAYLPTVLQIGGSAQTINWQGGSTPSGNNSKKDAIAFTIFYDGSTYTVFGQLVTFG